MRSMILVGALALALLAASPPTMQHPRDAVAAAHVSDLAPTVAELPAAIVASHVKRDAVHAGFLAVKPSLSPIGMSPEVLAVAHGRDGLQPFASKDIELALLPLPAPNWRIVGPNGVRGVDVISRG